MSANQEKKKLIVEEIKEKIQNAKSMVFLDYKGLNVNNDILLRREFKKNNCEYKVYKNRLVLRALNDLGITGYEERLQNTLSVAFSYADETDAPRIAKKALADNPTMAIKFGIVGTDFVDEAGIKELAELPSREVLVAKLLSMLNAPATQLCGVLSANQRNLVYALDAVAKTKN